MDVDTGPRKSSRESRQSSMTLNTKSSKKKGKRKLDCFDEEEEVELSASSEEDLIEEEISEAYLCSLLGHAANYHYLWSIISFLFWNTFMYYPPFIHIRRRIDIKPTGIKSLIEMLVRKCGVEAVKAVMPEEHLKLLKNIRKNERKENLNPRQILIHCTQEQMFPAPEYCYFFKFLKQSHAEISKLRQMKFRRRADQDQNTMTGVGKELTSTPPAWQSRWNHSRIFSDLEDDVGDNGSAIENGRQARTTRASVSCQAQIRKIIVETQKKRQKTELGWLYTGIEYNSKKAGGDLKKKGKLEPYAYWPLERKLLNRGLERTASARKGMTNVMLTKDLKKLQGRSASSALAGAFKQRRGKK
ncbi:hypothetical protein KSP40_PGU000803 [Platanthera guangdongensis]|uniref:Uncharacterized protein n=1 Tax=Platanthera guangdongensis TaxID=2320717 RepID=A0ABR2ML22_9ASPA